MRMLEEFLAQKLKDANVDDADHVAKLLSDHMRTCTIKDFTWESGRLGDATIELNITASELEELDLKIARYLKELPTIIREGSAGDQGADV